MPLISSINAEGWSGEWASGTPPTFTPDSAPSTFSVSRQGFTATGAATTYTDTRTYTRRKRQPYPNQATDTATTVALDDYVYSTDTIAGVTNNNTTLGSPTPICAWAMPDRQVIGNTLHWEMVAFHRDFRLNRQVACVIVTATDGTNTVSQTISGTSLSTLCEDANTLEAFIGDLDISTLTANSFITLNAKVYPWIGNAASVLDSSANSTPREFSPRYFTRNPSLAASPPYAYVSSTGVNASGVWSTTAATAAASPFLTVKGALDALTGASDGCHIRIVNAVNWGGITTASKTQNSGALIIERAPGTTRANAILTLDAAASPKLITGLNAALTDGRIIFTDLTFKMGGAFTFAGSASPANLTLAFWNCTFDQNTVGNSVMGTNCPGIYVYGISLLNNTGTAWSTNTSKEYRITRGVTADLNSTVFEHWVVLGCNFSRPGNGQYRDPTKGFIAYNNKFLSQAAGSAVISISTVNSGETITGVAMVQNLFEFTGTALADRNVRMSSDTPLHGNTSHTIMYANTATGYSSAGRYNVIYDNSSEVRTHTLQRHLGDAITQLNTKGDVYVGTTASFPNPETHIGQFAYCHGVGCHANYTQFAVNSTTLLSEYQTYPGLGSLIGTSSTAPQTPNASVWTNYQGSTGSAGTATGGAGGGSYATVSGSPLRSIVKQTGLSRDLAGTARGTTTDSAGAYI